MMDTAPKDVKTMIEFARADAAVEHEEKMAAYWESYRAFLGRFANAHVDMEREGPRVDGRIGPGTVTFVVKGFEVAKTMVVTCGKDHCYQLKYFGRDAPKGPDRAQQLTVNGLDEACEVIADWVGRRKHELEAHEKSLKDGELIRSGFKTDGRGDEATARSAEEAREFFLKNSSGFVTCLRGDDEEECHCYPEAEKFFMRTSGNR